VLFSKLVEIDYMCYGIKKILLNIKMILISISYMSVSGWVTDWHLAALAIVVYLNVFVLLLGALITAFVTVALHLVHFTVRSPSLVVVGAHLKVNITASFIPQ
jgi:hypothetical protein